MAPKLPPPANTKAVLAGPAWLGRAKDSFAPGTGVGRRPRGVRRGYSRRKPGCAINIGCGMPSFRGARERSPRNLLIVVPAKAGTEITIDVCWYVGPWPQLWQTCPAVAMGPGSRPGRQLTA